MALMEFFGSYEPINTLEAFLGDFGDFDFEPETDFDPKRNDQRSFLKIA